MLNSFTLNELLKRGQKDSFYRLDIVRGVSFESAYDSSMPFQTLIVNFSRYSDEYQSLDNIKAIPVKDIFKSKQIDIEANLSIKVDVTNQIFLKPGTVWRNGSPVWESTELTNVTLNQQEVSIVSISKEKGEGTKIPFIHNGLGIQLLKFPNSTVNGKTVTVLIPTTEVIRYYFAGSTYFTTELFNGALKNFKYSKQANRLFFKYNYDKENESVYIWLKRHCYDSDAFMIARALADDVAMNAMNHIYASLVHVRREFKTNTECCPRASLPFVGETNLEVLGQWLPPKEGEETFTTYMIRTIESCDHPLPFKKTQIESVDSFKSADNLNDAKAKPSKPKRQQGTDEQGQATQLTQGEKPTNKIAPEELKFMMQRFSHFDESLIEKIDRASDKDKQRYYQEEISSTSPLGSTLPSDYKKDNALQPWNIRAISSDVIPIAERIDTVSSTVTKILEKHKNWSAKALPAGFVDDTIPFGLYSFERPANKSSNYVWNMIGSRQRKALLIAISNQTDKQVWLLEIEGKAAVSYSLFLFGVSSEVTTSDFDRKLMFDIAISSGSKIKEGALKGVTVTTMKHTESENDSFEDRLKRAINSIFVGANDVSSEDTDNSIN